MKTILLILCCTPAIFAADETCAWMNAASAAGYLETTVHVAAVKRNDDGTCDFSGQRGPAAVYLWIEVTTLAEAQTPKCGPDPAPLRGIGNEAAVCDYHDKSGKISEQVVGRVRKQAFTVRLTSSDPAARRSDLRTIVSRAAEQVAGNLF